MATSVSVVICTWNRARLLGQTLETFLRLRVPEGVTWELLVVNNNCTDGTDAVARQYADRLPLVLCHEPRPGKSNACNHAIVRARGDYLLWTDDDVVVPPDWLEENLRAFEEHQAHLVFGKVLPWWESGPPSWYSDRFAGMFALLDYGPKPFVVTDRAHQPYGVNMATRREVFRLGRYFGALCRRDASGAFFYELKMIRFAGLVREGLQHAGPGRRKALGAPAA
jgi:glycosyltransferase involved in cell wall biosynthesis